MSALILWFIFLFLGTVIVYVLAALGFAKKGNTERDNNCICENSEVRSTGRPSSNPYIVNSVVKTGAYAVPARGNDKSSKSVSKKQKNYSLVNDVYYKAYNEAESMMTDYNAAKKITNNSADLATFEDDYHFDNYAEDFKQGNDNDNENY